MSKSLLVGLLGQNIQLSRTPGVHEAEGKRLGLNYVYKILDTANYGASTPSVEDIFFAAKLCGFDGLNVTYPFKQEIISYIDVLDDDVKRVGALNTVVFRDGKSYGHNTDLWGFAEGFRREMSGVALGRVLQIGAGGAGSAVANALTQSGVSHLFITDIVFERALDLASRLEKIQTGTKVTAIPVHDVGKETFDGLVNTTPVGMDKNPGMPVERNVLRPNIWVADIIYFPLETELLRTAKTLGCRTLSGAAMAVFQAVKAFELFSGLVIVRISIWMKLHGKTPI